MSKNITAIILAAGEGKRMSSKTPKVLHKVCGKAMLRHVVDVAKAMDCQTIVTVLGHCYDEVSQAVMDCEHVRQDEQLGTGHAVMQAQEYIKDGVVMVLCGDTPLLTSKTLDDAYHYHVTNKNQATVLTAVFAEPKGYGRIIRGDNNKVIAIVEEKDASMQQRLVKEINSGVYFFNAIILKKMLKGLNNKNAQGEYYLTDVIAGINKEAGKVGAYIMENPDETMGVSNKLQLSYVNDIMQRAILERHMMAGVTILDINSTYIEMDVVIERDVTIYPNTIIEGQTFIGEDSVIGPNTRITDCEVGKGTKIDNSVCIKTKIGQETNIGPFAYLRPGNIIGEHVKIGDFVEVKNSTIGDGTKIAHLTYIGDGDVGKNCNFGCGSVFVNYDGVNKYRSNVGDNCFIGCNVNLVSPVKIGDDAYIAAGTTITQDVPENVLAIGRVRQEIKKKKNK